MKAPQVAARRVAFVVGNCEYVSASTLKNAVNDARAVAASLARLGFEVWGGSGPSQPGENLTRGQLYDRFEHFARRVGPGSTAVIYFAGHGLQVDDQNFIVPGDARLQGEAPLTELVPLRKLIERTAIAAGRTGRTLVFLDACREEPFSMEQMRNLAENARAISGQRSTRPMAYVNNSFATVRLKAGDNASPTFISFATAPGEFAYDGLGGNSPFTMALVEHMNTRGLAIDDLIDRVNLDVLDRAEREGHVQDPWHETNLNEGFYFHPPTFRPMWELMGLGLLAGLVTCFLIFEDAAGVRRAANSPPWLWATGIFYALVVGYGVMQWGSRQLHDAAIAGLATMLAFAAAVWLLQREVVVNSMSLQRVKDDLNREGISIFKQFFSRAELVAPTVLALLAGIILAVGSVLGCYPQRGTVFRGFGAANGAIVVGLCMGVFFVLYLLIRRNLPTGIEPIHVLIALGGMWFAVAGAQLGYCFAHYVPEHRRIRGR